VVVSFEAGYFSVLSKVGYKALSGWMNVEFEGT
jgi:hypothetical protein